MSSQARSPSKRREEVDFSRARLEAALAKSIDDPEITARAMASRFDCGVGHVVEVAKELGLKFVLGGGIAKSDPRVWLIGENNPYSNDPRYDLYFDPGGSAGSILCRSILGMREKDYIRSFVRRNLLRRPKWSARLARLSAEEIRREVKAGEVVVLLGEKVWDAWAPLEFGREASGFAPFWIRGNIVALPHPSGRNRTWNTTETSTREEKIKLARNTLIGAAPWLGSIIGLASEERE